MASVKVVAYFMHEQEEEFLTKFMGSADNSKKTDSFFIADMEENAVDQLEQNGIVYELIQTPKLPNYDILNPELLNFRDKSTCRILLPDIKGLDISTTEKENTFPGIYKFSVIGPLLDEYKESLQNIQVEIVEFDPPSFYVVH